MGARSRRSWDPRGRTGATFAEAAVEWRRYFEHDRGRKPSTAQGYRSALGAHLLPAFGSVALEDVPTGAIERWLVGFTGSARTRNKLLIQLHGILRRARKVYCLPSSAAAEIEKFPQLLHSVYCDRRFGGPPDDEAIAREMRALRA